MVSCRQPNMTDVKTFVESLKIGGVDIVEMKRIMTESCISTKGGSKRSKKGGRILLGGIHHSGKSLFPTHAGNWRTHLKKLLGLQQPIPYISYKYSFFLKEFDKLEFSQISYFPCKIQLDGWDSKYHVLLKK